MINPIEARAKEILDRTVGRRMKPLMDRLGNVLVGQSQTAFHRQRFGNNFPWVHKYPNQGGKFINVAGAVADFNRGLKAPSARTFVRAPALLSTKKLFHSVTSRTTKRNEVTHGSSNPKAKYHQWGLVTTQRVSPGSKERIKDWLNTPESEEYRGKMRFLTRPNNTTLDTEVNQRPFVGITDEIEPSLVKMVENYFNA